MFKVGDVVKAVRASHGWASVEKGHVGTIRQMSRGTIYVDFPTHRNWAAAERDIELVQESKPAKFKNNEKAIVTNGIGSNFADNTVVTIMHQDKVDARGAIYVVSGRAKDGRLVQQYIREKNLAKNIQNNQQALKLLRRD